MSSPILWGPNNYANNLENAELTANGTLLAYNGPKNYISYGNFENQLTTGWSLGTTGTLTNGIPTGTPTFGSGASANLSISLYTAAPLAGTASLQYVSSAATTAGNMVASQAYTLDAEDQSRVLQFQLSYKVLTGTGDFSGTSTSSFGIAIWDVTNSAWLNVSGPFSMVSNGVGIATGTVQTATTASIRFVIYNANATSGAITMLFDSFFVGPQIVSIGPAMSDWLTYTGSMTYGATTATNISSQTYKYKRVGDSIHLSAVINFNGAANASGTMQIPLPPGLVIDSTKLAASYNDFAGTANYYQASGNKQWGPGVINAYGGANSGGNSYIIITQASPSGISSQFWSGNTTAASNVPTGAAIANTDNIILNAVNIPIVGWSSNTVQSSSTDTRVLAAKYTTTGNSLGTSATLISFSNRVYDLGANYSAGTFTVPVTGIWEVAVAINTVSTSWAANGGVNLYLYKNGSSDTQMGGVATPSVTMSLLANATTQVSCNAGDTLAIYTISSVATTLNATAANNWVSFKRLSGPAIIQATDTVAARYNTTAGQSIPNSVDTIINYDTKDYDLTNSTTTGASWKYTIPVSGKYLISAQALFDNGTAIAAGSNVYFYIQKNGVNTVGNLVVNTGAGVNKIAVMIADNLNLVAGDYISIAINQNSGGARLLSTDAKQNKVFIQRIGN